MKCQFQNYKRHLRVQYKEQKQGFVYNGKGIDWIKTEAQILRWDLFNKTQLLYWLTAFTIYVLLLPLSNKKIVGDKM